MYFRVLIDKTKENYWFLAELHDKKNNSIEEFDFQRGKFFNFKDDLYYHIKNEGKPTDFCFAGYAMVPIVTQNIMNDIKKIENNAIQFIPVKIEKISKVYYIINTLQIIDCIDLSRSHFMELDQPPLPRYTFYSLIIDESKIAAHIFRPQKLKSAFIISKEIKEILCKYNMDGIIFKKVTL